MNETLCDTWFKVEMLTEGRSTELPVRVARVSRVERRGVFHRGFSLDSETVCMDPKGSRIGR